MDHIQLLSLTLSIAFLLLVTAFVRRQRVRERQAFHWLLLAAATVATAAALPLLNRLAGRLGIAYMPALVFVLAFFAVLVLVMLQASALSVLQSQVTTLAQELAELRLELEDGQTRQHAAALADSAGALADSAGPSSAEAQPDNLPGPASARPQAISERGT